MDSYGPLCTEFYDLDKPEPPAGALRFHLARARDAGGPVLEPMCGSGRFLLPLLAAGVDIDGTDASPSMLQACRRHAARRGLPVPSLFEQPLHELSLPRRYRMAFVPSGSIGLIASDDELHAALQALRRHLQPGGSLWLEVVEPDPDGTAPADEAFEPRSVRVDDDTRIDYRCRASRSPDGRTVRYEGLYEKRRGDAVLATEYETIRLRLHDAGAMCARLRDVGFARTRVVGPREHPWLADGGCALVEAVVEGDDEGDA